MARHILPELNAASGVNDKPLLRADCLKFVNTFRNQLPAATLADLLPTAGAHVLSESQVGGLVGKAGGGGVADEVVFLLLRSLSLICLYVCIPRRLALSLSCFLSVVCSPILSLFFFIQQLGGGIVCG
jgi:hypothetical protein